MSLPANVEELLAVCERRIRAQRLERADIQSQLDALAAAEADRDDGDDFREPSVVREIEQLSHVERRVHRAASTP